MPLRLRQGAVRCVTDHQCTSSYLEAGPSPHRNQAPPGRANDHYREGDKGPLATHCIGVTGGPVPRFEKVEREEPAKGVVMKGDDP